jgi:hypothetical protein
MLLNDDEHIVDLRQNTTIMIVTTTTTPNKTTTKTKTRTTKTKLIPFVLIQFSLLGMFLGLTTIRNIWTENNYFYFPSYHHHHHHSWTSHIKHQKLTTNKYDVMKIESSSSSSSLLRRHQIENYRNGTGLMLNVHITHHGGTART